MTSDPPAAHHWELVKMQSLRTGFHKPQIEKNSHTATEDPACHKENQRSHMQQLRPSAAKKQNKQKTHTHKKKPFKKSSNKI